MPKHFFETRIFSFAMVFATLAVMAGLGFVFYPKYLAEVQLEFYAPSNSAIKIGEDVKVKHRSNKSASWSEYIPCTTVKLSDADPPITACKLTGFVDSPDAARQFLASNYASASGFTVYVSPDKHQASLEGFNPARARSALMPLLLIGTIVPAFNLGLWFFLWSMVKKTKVGAGN